MKSSKILIEKLKEFEGFRSTAYRCPAGVYTIGYGHTKDVTPTMSITENEAEQFLNQDLEFAENVVNKLGVFTQGQFDALVSLCFNIGSRNFLASTLCEMVRQNRFDKKIKNEFMKWVYSGRRKLPGLMNRRRWEASRYYE